MPEDYEPRIPGFNTRKYVPTGMGEKTPGSAVKGFPKKKVTEP